MADKTYTETELKEIASKFAIWYKENCLEGDKWGDVNDHTGYPIDMLFDKFTKTEL